jgi:tRNASer (uridine44-2'-O)-methyltransferase
LNPIDGEVEAMPLSATQDIMDNIVPEHLVKNTYSRLKTLYASDLIKRWVDKTHPSKHVFEDLSIAAFLIELWRKMYGSNPSDFPGFVDIACGNGVLVYILVTEGFRGWGFDARVRRTWAIFPNVITAHLKEAACIPRPFLEALESQAYQLPDDLLIHNGVFDGRTFIISNHADELTTWTPLLAALSCPESPLPWLAVPCCSHALSGAAHRYQSCAQRMSGAQAGSDTEKLHHDSDAEVDRDEQPRTGDLTALRNQNPARWKLGQSGGTTSMYVSLVNQVICLAGKVDPLGDVQQTLMRLPSTRNIGVVGGQQRTVQPERAGKDNLIHRTSSPKQIEQVKHAELVKQIYDVVEQECGRSDDGVAKAAKIWMEGVKKARGPTPHACGLVRTLGE